MLHLHPILVWSLSRTSLRCSALRSASQHVMCRVSNHSSARNKAWSSPHHFPGLWCSSPLPPCNLGLVSGFGLPSITALYGLGCLGLVKPHSLQVWGLPAIKYGVCQPSTATHHLLLGPRAFWRFVSPLLTPCHHLVGQVLKLECQLGAFYAWFCFHCRLRRNDMFAAQCGGFRFGGFGHQSGVQAMANPIPDYFDEEILVRRHRFFLGEPEILNTMKCHKALT